MPRTTRRTVSNGRHPHGGCPACSGIEVLQEKWVLYIVHALLEGPMGFNAISREVGGCNPTTLAQRLSRLESLGIIEKLEAGEASAPNGNGRSCYRLTAAGRSLEIVIDAIRGWAVGNLRTAAR